ncbi:polysaccharide export outer membrane protein [Thiocapsa rosea]|uniref:Polysaccharide export outer membrane protein n=2 Tax=Thiocapsa rosea TaxID=69360 RepID=A0A495V9Y0_9GAMM|nr:polysaccharide export outer membrane protein [Thiocapsa rosea]
MSEFMSRLIFARWSGVLLVLVVALMGCASPRSDGSDAAAAGSIAAEAQARAEQARVMDLNRQLTLAATSQSSNLSTHDYRLGPGDVIKIEAPQAPEINSLSVRITGPGTVNLPLVGEVRLGGLTTAQAEQSLMQSLSKYIHSPQVAIFINEYASQEVTVTGAVGRPGVYPMQRPRTLFEVLSMAGGLAPNAGSTVSVRTGVPDPQTGQVATHNLIVDLRDLVKDPSAQALALRGGDSVYVPEAGVFFVEGAVAKSGSFPLRPDMTVLKAIAMAGGTDWTSVEKNIRVIRHDGTGSPRELPVDLVAIRDLGQEDMRLQDGDVVVVDTNYAKKGAVVMWNQALRVLSLGILYQ